MTREEAKEILTHNWTRVDNPNYSESELDEAFFMAISALSSEHKDCTDFLCWLLEEIMDEENWELNAEADGEIIARKLKKLGLLDSKDGYYVRTPMYEALTEPSDLMSHEEAWDMIESDLISRADAIKAICNAQCELDVPHYPQCDQVKYCDDIKALLALPSADIPTEDYSDLPDIPRAYYEKIVGNMSHEINMLKQQLEDRPSVSAEPTSDDLIIVGGKNIQDGLYNIKDGKLFMYKANGGTVRSYPIVPSAEPTTRERKEAKSTLLTLKHLFEDEQILKSLDVAIECVSAERVVIGIDQPLHNDIGVLVKGTQKNDCLYLEDIHELVKIVRCKDCEYRDGNDCWHNRDLALHDDDFCSLAKMKGGAE